MYSHHCSIPGAQVSCIKYDTVAALGLSTHKYLKAVLVLGLQMGRM